MDYYIYVTKNCNISCRYCCENQEWSSIKGFKNINGPVYKIPELVDFIIKNKDILKDEDVQIIFYGGEPLLNQNWIKEFIKTTEKCNFVYTLFTNGTLLSQADKYILNKLDFLFISTDGSESINDKYRGKGNFRKVMNNLKLIQKDFYGLTIAMMTITPYNKINESVLNIVDKFDFVYWKLLSCNKLENVEQFKDNYDKGLDILIKYWIDDMKKGKIKRIIPFLAIIKTLLEGIQHKNFRCDCGEILVTIDTDGSCYSCDELVNEEFKVGTVYSSIKQKKLHHVNRCKKCEYRYICGGRCPKEDLLFPKEIANYHCKLTKLLISKLVRKLPEIKELVDNGTIQRKDFNYPHTTSEIP